MPETIFESFLRTTYIARTPFGEIRIRIGELNSALDELLQVHHATRWAFITAWNPMSQALTDAENRLRQLALTKDLSNEGLRFVDGEGRGDSGEWPPEESFLVLAIEQAQAVELAKKYQQLAIVVGELRGTPMLIDCR